MHAGLKHTIFSLWMFATSLLINASEFKFKSFNTQDGLNNSSVFDIYKDSQGLLWVGTNRGVSLFTGQDFIPLNHFISDSAHSAFSTIEQINELHANELWVGTWGDGIYSVNIVTGEYHHYRSNHDNPESSISNNYINCTYNNQFKELWIGTPYGLNITKGDGVFEHFLFEETLTKGLPDIKAIIPKYDQLIVVFTKKGEILEINMESGTYKKVADISHTDIDISIVHKDSRDYYWVGTKNDGIILLDSHYNSLQLKLPLKSLKESTITDITSNTKGDIFIATDGNGLYRLSANFEDLILIKNNASDHYSLPGNQLECILIDNDDILWIGYFKDGFSRTILKNDGIKHYYKNRFSNADLPNKIVNCFAEDPNGYIWIGTESGLTVFDHNNEKYLSEEPAYATIIRKIGKRPITALHYSQNKRQLLVGTYNKGLFYVDMDTYHLVNTTTENSPLQSNFIRYIHEDKAGTFYIATLSGGTYSLNNKILKPLHIFHDNGYELKDFFHITSNNDHLWISSAGAGALKINKKGTSGQMFTNLDLRLANSSAYTSDSSFWVGTDTGLYQYNETTDNFEYIKLNEESIDILGILEDNKENIWLSSSQGLYQYNRTKHKIHQIQSYNIQGTEFQNGSFYKLSDGCLLFGGNNGFNIVNPSTYSQNKSSSSIFISSLQIYNQVIKAGSLYDYDYKLEKHINFCDEITLPYNTILLGLKVNIINYFNDQPNKIAYSLSSKEDSSKIILSSPDLTFHSLPFGQNTLKIYLLSSDNKPMANYSRSIKIIKDTPWWKQTWFIYLVAAIILILLVSRYRIRIYRLRQNKIQLEKMVSQKTLDLQKKTKEIEQQRDELKNTLNANRRLEKFKEVLINMIVHDLKNPLNSIIGLSSLNEPIFLKNIYHTSNLMLHLVENILDVRKYETHSLKLFKRTTNLKSISENAIEEVSYLLDLKKNSITNHTDTLNIIIDPDLIKRVYVNLLTNAIKFSPQEGTVTIHCSQNKNHIIVSISDEGKGIPFELQDSVFDMYKQIDIKKSGKVNSTGIGLSFCKMAIESHGGTIWVDNLYRNGAKISFSIPNHIK